MEQCEWEQYIINYMLNGGWINDRNDEKTLGFSFKDTNGDTWIRDYDKKNHRFVHYNGDQKVNIRFRAQSDGEF